jgi:predicted ester cyclase
LRFEIEDLIADGQTVALRATWRGESLRQRGLVFLRVNDAGRIRERFSAYTPL